MASHVDPEAWAKKRKKRTILLVSISALVVILFVVFALMKNHIVPAITYARAETAISRGEPETAIARFYSIGTYRDADARGAALAAEFGENASILEQLKNVSVGDVVAFGHYEQDNVPDNGSEPIRWHVLGKENGRLLLLSIYCLDQQFYHKSNGNITWENCTLREWLNGDFMQSAFSKEEQLLIPEVLNLNKANPASGAGAGSNTKDRVFLLSYEDVVRYMPADGDLRLYTYATDYAAARGLTPHSEYKTAYWWMRTPGVTRDTVMYVDMIGSALHARRANTDCGVRPAIWVVIGE